MAEVRLICIRGNGDSVGDIVLVNLQLFKLVGKKGLGFGHLSKLPVFVEQGDLDVCAGRIRIQTGNMGLVFELVGALDLEFE